MHYFVSYVNISVLLATIVKKNLRNNLGLRVVNACQSFITMTEWCERQMTCRQVIGNIKHVKSYRKFVQSCILKKETKLLSL